MRMCLRHSIARAAMLVAAVSVAPGVPGAEESYRPWVDLGALFDDVQQSAIFPDSKTFVDCIPNSNPAEIRSAHERTKNQEAFRLSEFVEARFECPAPGPDTGFRTDKPFERHLNAHWDHLVRSAERPAQYSTLIALPNEYVVPGGRFREVYYWDSYFTTIGLAASGRLALMTSMLDNFAFLVDRLGFIPNGNRTYYEGRSQPPFFAAMVNLYMQVASTQSALKYLPALRREYEFWMDGQERLAPDTPSHRRVVLYRGAVLNRYWDDYDLPRPESYREDTELGRRLSEAGQRRLYRELRAGAESGWDYSTRWFADSGDFASIRTTAILPVDLNSLMFFLESTLAVLYRAAGDDDAWRRFLEKSAARAAAVNELFWNPGAGQFQDILWPEAQFTGRVTAASFYPMYFRAARPELARIQVPLLLEALLAAGGILTTTEASGQQWDKPNGWAPLQWIASKGLVHYGFAGAANEIERRWLAVNRRVFANSGKMMEKYNVSDTTLSAGGGEYPAQDGFGWTNGVALGFLEDGAAY